MPITHNGGFYEGGEEREREERRKSALTGEGSKETILGAEAERCSVVGRRRRREQGHKAAL